MRPFLSDGLRPRRLDEDQRWIAIGAISSGRPATGQPSLHALAIAATTLARVSAETSSAISQQSYLLQQRWRKAEWARHCEGVAGLRETHIVGES